jgi:glutathione S-transferase/GST-like protein
LRTGARLEARWSANIGSMLTLYHWEPNANSGKPALEKGVEFESRYIDMLGFEQHSPEYLEVNPNGTIPAMVHDGVLVHSRWG